MDTASVKFHYYDSPVEGLYTDDNYMVFKWSEGGVFFSVCKRGESACMHLACEKQELRSLRRVSSEFVDFVFWMFPWCKMVIAQITKPSVERIAVKIGFSLLGYGEGATVYMRCRNGQFC